MPQLKSCPKCGSVLRTHSALDRWNRQICAQTEEDCDWQGEPYRPKKKPVKAKKSIFTDADGWTYEGFDQYGHCFVYSESFSSQAACRAAAKQALARVAKFPGYKGATAVIWPPRVFLYGELVRL